MRHRQISRRTVLKAGGVALALPMLDIMRPRRASADLEVRRHVNICGTLGFFREAWEPAATGPSYQDTEYLSLLNEHRANYTILSGLSQEEQQRIQPHNSEITWLTSARHPGTDGFQNTISIDQAMAKHLGYQTRFPSLTLGTFSPQSQSYTDTGVMIPAIISPANLFAAMFLQGTPEEVAQQKARLTDGGSVLDYLLDKQATFRADLGASDKHALDAYFQAVREAEMQLGEVAAWSERPKPSIDAEQPVDEGNGSYLINRISLMMKLIPLILQTRSSDVVSLMIQDHGSVPLDVPGVSNDQHNLSHHGQQPAKIADLKLVEKEILKVFKVFLDDLAERQDGNGTLLDQTAVLFGSNLGNASSHDSRHVPILVAGGGFHHGEHIANGEDGQDAPLCNLFVTLLQRMGVAVESFGQSTGTLTWEPTPRVGVSRGGSLEPGSRLRRLLNPRAN